MQPKFHSKYLREAIRLSMEKMQANEGGPFGAVIVRHGQEHEGGEIIASGWNRVTSTFDPTAHAEITAIREACGRLSTVSLTGCSIYTSCEPCPMCLAAIYWARLDKIYFAAGRADAAAAGFDDDLFYRELAKPHSDRNVPMEQHLRTEAVVAFDAWRTKPDRIAY